MLVRGSFGEILEVPAVLEPAAFLSSASVSLHASSDTEVVDNKYVA